MLSANRKLICREEICSKWNCCERNRTITDAMLGFAGLREDEN